MRPLDLDIPYHPGPEHLVAAEWRHLEPTLGQLCEAFGHHMIDDLHCPWDRTVHIEKVEAPWQLGFMSQVLQLLRARAPRFRAALIGSVPALTAVI